MICKWLIIIYKALLSANPVRAHDRMDSIPDAADEILPATHNQYSALIDSFRLPDS